jgi:hypothetical protein
MTLKYLLGQKFDHKKINPFFPLHNKLTYPKCEEKDFAFSDNFTTYEPEIYSKLRRVRIYTIYSLGAGLSDSIK